MQQFTVGEVKCPKCGSPEVRTQYCAGIYYKIHVLACQYSQEEHMHRICLSCEYDWKELPLDALNSARKIST